MTINIKRGARAPHLCPAVFLIIALALFIGACSPIIMAPGPKDKVPAISDVAFTMPDGASLPLHVWLPKSEENTYAVIIALHGFNDYGLFFSDFAEYLERENVISYAYDQRGFGRAPYPGYWAGTDAYVDDIKEILQLVKDRHPELPIFLFGESMGGAVLISLIASDTERSVNVDGIILAAPAVWAREVMPFYQRWALWLASHTMPWLKVSGRGLQIKPSDNVEMLRALGQDPLIIKETRVDAIWGLANLMDRALIGSSEFDRKVLILYGTRDEVIRKSTMLEMLHRLPLEASPMRKIAIYDGGYHMLIRDLSAETYWRDVLAWMRNPLNPLPSGADHSGLEASE